MQSDPLIDTAAPSEGAVKAAWRPIGGNVQSKGTLRCHNAGVYLKADTCSPSSLPLTPFPPQTLVSPCFVLPPSLPPSLLFSQLNHSDAAPEAEWKQRTAPGLFGGGKRQVAVTLPSQTYSAGEQVRGGGARKYSR